MSSTLSLEKRLGSAIKYLAALLLSMIVATNAQAQRQREVDRNIAVIQSFLKLPDNQIDLAKVNIAVDRMIDPKLDDKNTLKTLDNMAASVARMVSFNASSKEKIDALRAYLYQSGAWNNNQVFAYDLAGDPKGFKISNKLIANYLKSRKGNCVSMPLLFVILGQKLGVNVTIAHAPEHLFVRYIDESRQIFNLEATYGAGLKRDASYKTEFEITQKAINNGFYLRSLSKKETVLTVSLKLAEHYSDIKDADSLMAMADFYLNQDKKSLDGMLHKAHAYYLLIERDYVSKFPKPSDIPLDKRSKFIEFDTSNIEWFRKAAALGWHAPSEKHQKNYNEIVNRALEIEK
jgi:regulator of sirC expression with transglutaminase-like and TPR domain